MGISVETLTLAKAFTKEYVAEYGGIKEIYEYDEYSYFPAQGDTECFYVDKSTGRIYRWSGSIYVEISAETIRSLLVAANNGKVVGILNGDFVAVEQTENPLDGMDVAANNGKAIGVVNGAFAAVTMPDPLNGMNVAANNGKVLSVQNGSFSMVSPDTLFPNGDNIQY